MKILIKSIALLFCLSSTFISIAQTSKISKKDLKQLNGMWEGHLIYLDYSSAKQKKISANSSIHQVGRTNRFIIKNTYPNETGANSVDTLNILGKAQC